MDANTEVTLDQVHDGILAAVRAQFPDLATVEAYPQDRGPVVVPAFLLEMTEMAGDPELDPGTGQLGVMATFEAQLVMSFSQPGKNPKREIRKLAAAFAAFALRQRWGCPIGPAEIVGIYPDDFAPELDQYECWRVEWRQVIHLGETVWKGEGITPTTIMLGFVPNVGAAHEADYIQVDQLPQLEPAE